MLTPPRTAVAKISKLARKLLLGLRPLLETVNWRRNEHQTPIRLVRSLGRGLLGLGQAQALRATAALHRRSHPVSAEAMRCAHCDDGRKMPPDAKLSVGIAWCPEC